MPSVTKKHHIQDGWCPGPHSKRWPSEYGASQSVTDTSALLKGSINFILLHEPPTCSDYCIVILSVCKAKFKVYNCVRAVTHSPRLCLISELLHGAFRLATAWHNSVGLLLLLELLLHSGGCYVNVSAYAPPPLHRDLYYLLCALEF